MTIIKNGGIFGRGGDGSFDDLTVTGSVTVPANSISGNAIDGGTAGVDNLIADDVITAGGTTVTHGANSDGTIRVEGTSAPAFAINDTGQSKEYFLTALGDFVQMRYADAGDTGGFANSTSLLTMEATGDVTVNTGNLVIGTSGKGIDFSATSGTGTSELFDDYEEGVFNVAFVTTSGSITISSTADTMSYTKIGNIVHIQGYLASSAVSSPSGDLKITGLPFTSANGIAELGDYAVGTVWLTGTSADIDGGVIAYIPPGSTNLFFRVNAVSGANNTVASSVDSGTEFMIGLTYTAA
jgi:hypothetical protein